MIDKCLLRTASYRTRLSYLNKPHFQGKPSSCISEPRRRAVFFSRRSILVALLDHKSQPGPLLSGRDWRYVVTWSGNRQDLATSLSRTVASVALDGHEIGKSGARQGLNPIARGVGAPGTSSFQCLLRGVLNVSQRIGLANQVAREGSLSSTS